MNTCPFCQQTIEVTLVIEGGYCPHCDELILVDYLEDNVDGYEATEVIAEEDLPTDLLEETEEVDKTSPLLGGLDNNFSVPDIVSLKKETVGVPEALFTDDEDTAIEVGVVVKEDDPMDDFLVEEESEESEEFEDEDFGLDPSLEKDFRKRPALRRTLSKEWLVGLLVVIVCIVIILLPPKEKNELEDVDQGWTANDVKSHKGNEVEEKNKPPQQKRTSSKLKNTSNSTKKKQEREKPKVVEVDGMAFLSTSGPKNSGMQVADLGAMSTNDRIERDITKLRKNLGYCHTKVLKKNPTVKGKWEISFTIRASSEVKNIRVKPLRKTNSEMEECMSGRIKKFDFSKPESAYPVKFSILFG